jgi:hypothetical protein
MAAKSNLQLRREELLPTIDLAHQANATLNPNQGIRAIGEVRDKEYDDNRDREYDDNRDSIGYVIARKVRSNPLYK